MKPYYQDAFATIYHGDCRDFVPDLPMHDLVLTDPPYGIGESSRKNASRGKPFGKNKGSSIISPRDYGAYAWDAKPIDIDLLRLVVGAGIHVIIWGGNFYSANLPSSSCWLVWDKDNTGDFADCELAWTNLKNAVRRIRWRWNGMLQENMADKEKRFHPTQKPLPVMKWCLGIAPRTCRTVLDPFMGSGTTLVASKMVGLQSVGIDREERYCEIAARRLAQEYLQLVDASKPKQSEMNQASIEFLSHE